MTPQLKTINSEYWRRYKTKLYHNYNFLLWNFLHYPLWKTFPCNVSISKHLRKCYWLTALKKSQIATVKTRTKGFDSIGCLQQNWNAKTKKALSFCKQLLMQAFCKTSKTAATFYECEFVLRQKPVNFSLILDLGKTWLMSKIAKNAQSRKDEARGGGAPRPDNFGGRSDIETPNGLNVWA